MIFCRATICALLLCFVAAGCTSSQEVYEKADPQEEPVTTDPKPEPAVPAAPADMDAEEFSDEAEMNEGAAEDVAPSDGAAGATEESGGKGGIISSGVKKKKKPCMEIANPRQRQLCLERLKQKP